MFLDRISKIKQKINNTKFKNQIKIEKKRIFIDNLEKSERYTKKRKHIKFNYPKIESQFIKDNIKLIITLSFLGLVLLFILILFTPIFGVSKINIELEDNNTLIDLNIAYKSVDYFRNKNNLLIDNEEVFQQLTNYQKNIVRVEVNKEIFNKVLNLKIKSSKPIFYTYIDGKKYIITENGVLVYINNKIFKELSEIKLSLKDKSTNLSEYKKILNEVYLQRILRLKNELEKNIVGVKIKNIYYFEKERESHFDLSNNTKLIFDINTEDINEQMRKIIVFNKEHINLNNSDNIYYIDLRVPNKIYYCDKEFVWNCKKNLNSLYDIYE